MSVGDARVKLSLWDTAGQERFRAITRQYYRAMHAVVFGKLQASASCCIHLLDCAVHAWSFISGGDHGDRRFIMTDHSWFSWIQQS